MRDIKFRAWEKNIRCMIPVDDINFTTQIINTSCAWRMFNEIVLMQYTGLKDSAGTEIYEGDICWDEIKERAGTVDFYEGSFGYISENDYEELGEINKEIEVIGNIYENKELLEVAK